MWEDRICRHLADEAQQYSVAWWADSCDEIHSWYFFQRRSIMLSLLSRLSWVIWFEIIVSFDILKGVMIEDLDLQIISLLLGFVHPLMPAFLWLIDFRWIIDWDQEKHHPPRDSGAIQCSSRTTYRYPENCSGKGASDLDPWQGIFNTCPKIPITNTYLGSNDAPKSFSSKWPQNPLCSAHRPTKQWISPCIFKVSHPSIKGPQWCFLDWWAHTRT